MRTDSLRTIIMLAAWALACSFTRAGAGALPPNATLTDSLAVDVNHNGKADAGDTLLYTVEITQPGDQDTTQVVLNLPLDKHTKLVPGARKSTPLARDDDITTRVGVLILPAPGVLANDSDPDGQPMHVTAFDAASSSGATVNVSADGGFSYDPATIFDLLPLNETALDLFHYTASDTDGNPDSATVTITLIGTNEPPVASDETYSALGNTQLVAGNGTVAPTGVANTTDPHNLLDNATDPDGPHSSLSVIAFTGASANGGDVDVRADGSFAYTPPAGLSGLDTFTYQVFDGGNLSAPATVTINVAAPQVWYIDNQNGPQNPPGGDGRSTNPFDTLAAFMAVQGGGAGAPGPGDVIYVLAGNGTIAGLDTGIALLASQSLIGEGVALVVNATTLRAAGTRPLLGNSAGDAIQLATNNTVRGLNVAEAAPSSAGIVGSSVGSAVADHVAVNVNATAVSINGGALAMAFDSLESDNAAAGGLALQNVSGTFTVSGATAINHSSGTGALLNDNGATVTLGLLNIDNSATNQRGLHATENSGRIQTAGGSITTGSGIPVEITKSSGTTPLDVTLTSVSCNGAANGIVLANTSASGGFAVTGSGGIVGSGGAIASTIHEGVKLQNAENVSLDYVEITGTGDSGVSGTGVANFALNHSHVLNAAQAAGEDGVAFAAPGLNNLSGAVEFTSTTISAPGHHALNIDNASGTISNLTVQNCIFQNTKSAGVGGSGIRLRTDGTAVITQGQIANSLFQHLDGSGVLADAIGAGSQMGQMNITGNTIDDVGANAIGCGTDGGAVATYNISNNPAMTNVFASHAISLPVFGTSSMTATVSANPDIAPDQPFQIGLYGIRIREDGANSAAATVAGNGIRLTDEQGFNAEARGAATTGPGISVLELKVGSNTVSQPKRSAPGMHFISRELNTLCLNIVTVGGAGNNDGTGNANAGYFLTQNGVSVFQLQGLGASTAQTVVQNNNTGTATTSGNYVDAACANTP